MLTVITIIIRRFIKRVCELDVRLNLVWSCTAGCHSVYDALDTRFSFGGGCFFFTLQSKFFDITFDAFTIRCVCDE